VHGAGKPSLRPVSPVRLTSHSFARQRHLLSEMYNMMGACMAAVQLNSTPVIACDHPLILCL